MVPITVATFMMLVALLVVKLSGDLHSGVGVDSGKPESQQWLVCYTQLGASNAAA
jgi:hypothetical protein